MEAVHPHREVYVSEQGPKKWYYQVFQALYAFPVNQVISMKWKMHIMVREANENLKFHFDSE